MTPLDKRTGAVPGPRSPAEAAPVPHLQEVEMLSPEGWGAVLAVLALVAGLPLAGWHVRRRERRRQRESEARSGQVHDSRLLATRATLAEHYAAEVRNRS